MQAMKLPIDGFVGESLHCIYSVAMLFVCCSCFWLRLLGPNLWVPIGIGQIESEVVVFVIGSFQKRQGNNRGRSKRSDNGGLLDYLWRLAQSKHGGDCCRYFYWAQGHQRPEKRSHADSAADVTREVAILVVGLALIIHLAVDAIVTAQAVTDKERIAPL